MIVQVLFEHEGTMPICDVEMPHAPRVGDDICLETDDRPNVVRRYTITSVVWWLRAEDSNPDFAVLNSCLVFVKPSGDVSSNVIDLKSGAMRN